MKLSHIIALLVIAVGIGVIISTAGETSQYVEFKTASEMASSGDDSDVHVVGKIKKDQSGQILMKYQPSLDPNYFEFILVDKNNQEHTVIYNNPKPQDFERSEQIVIVGHMEKDVFLAEKILLKCPSKYEDKELKTS